MEATHEVEIRREAGQFLPVRVMYAMATGIVGNVSRTSTEELIANISSVGETDRSLRAKALTLGQVGGSIVC